jgi:hypothetical protein
VAFALVAGAAVLGGVYYSARPGPTHEEVRLKLWREDSVACDRFAVRREDARRLLAYNPEDSLKPPEQQRAESEANLHDLGERVKKMGERMEADTRACLRGQGWPDASIEELKARDLRMEEAKARAKKGGAR